MFKSNRIVDNAVCLIAAIAIIPIIHFLISFLARSMGWPIPSFSAVLGIVGIILILGELVNFYTTRHSLTIIAANNALADAAVRDRQLREIIAAILIQNGEKYVLKDNAIKMAQIGLDRDFNLDFILDYPDTGSNQIVIKHEEIKLI